MNRVKYEEAEWEIISFDCEDVIRTSPIDPEPSSDPGEEFIDE